MNQYFKQYKQTIKNFSMIDQVLKQKIVGKIKPSKRYFDHRNKTINPKIQKMFDETGFPIQDVSDYEGNAQGDDDLIKQQQYDKKAFFTYLQDHKDKFHLKLRSKTNSIENMYY